MRFQIRLFIFLIGIVLYIWIFLIDYFRYTVLPTVDHGIGQMLQTKTITVPNNQKECFNLGGEWKAIGIFPQEVCRLPFSDGKKSCFSGFQCQAKRCIISHDASMPLTQGACPNFTPTVGCFTEVHFGIVGKIVCVD